MIDSEKYSRIMEKARIKSIKNFKKEESQKRVSDFIKKIKLIYHPKTVMGTRDELYLYYDRYYHSLGESMIGQLIDKEFGDVNTKSLGNEILYRIVNSNKIERESFKEMSYHLNLGNGVLDVLSNTMKEHSPNFNFLYVIDRDYYPDIVKDCSVIKKFLMEIVDGDENKYWLLVEFFGYILMSDYKIKKFLCLFGDGDNGKSTLASLMMEFIGKKNTSGLSLNQITEKDFLINCLYGKKLNIHGELMPTGIKSLEMMKSLTGGDEQHVDRKFKDPLMFKNEAKFLFHFNVLPEIDLKKIDQASLDRILLVHLKHNFTGVSDDKGLLAKLTSKDELEGLLYLALEGLRRLIKNGSFTYDNETTCDIWNENQKNDLDDFISKYCELDGSSFTEKSVMFDLYNRSGYAPKSMKSFTINMLKYPTISIGRRGSAGEQVRCYLGVKLKIVEWI